MHFAKTAMRDLFGGRIAGRLLKSVRLVVFGVLFAACTGQAFGSAAGADGYIWTANVAGKWWGSGHSPETSCRAAMDAYLATWRPDGMTYLGIDGPLYADADHTRYIDPPAYHCVYRLISGGIDNQLTMRSDACAPGYVDVAGSCERARPPARICPVGHPVIPGVGTKILTERDDAGSIELPLTRTYRSQVLFGLASGFGQWTFDWQRALDTGAVTTATVTINPSKVPISALRGDGETYIFHSSGSLWTAAGTRDTLLGVVDGSGVVTAWQYTVTDTGTIETYDVKGNLLSVRERNGRTSTLTYNAANQLTSVAAPSGRSLTFAYDAQNRVSSIAAPDGAITKYAYNATGMLTTVTWPDNTTRQYVYEDSRFPTALTGVIDEAGVRYATYAYDDQARAITSELTAGADRYQFQYQANGQTTVLTPDGGSSVYSFLKQNGVLLPTGVSAPCPTCGNTALSTSYDSNNNATSKTGYDGSITSYTYDTLGRETQRIEGAGTANAKTTTTEWDPQQWLVTRVAAPNKIEAFSYDANGNLLSHTVTPTGDANGSQGFGAAASADAESTEWTYDPNGNVLTAAERNGSSATATWVFTYDAQGNLLTLTNPSGQVGRATHYDASGRLLEAVDVNGVQIKYAYNARGWLTDYDFGDQHIKYEYDAVGLLVKASGPQDNITRYIYDAAHRLIEVLDNLTVSSTEASVDISQSPFKAAEAKSLTRIDRAWNSVVEWLKQWLSKLIASAHAQAAPGSMTSYQLPGPISQGAQPSYAWPTAMDVIDPNLDRSRIDPRMAVLRWYVRVQAACAAAVNSLVQLASDRQTEYRKAKDFCDDPPDPGDNECSTLSRQIDHAKQCIALYSAWDAKWLPGRHDEKIQGWRTRLSNLITDHKKRCTTKP